VFGASVINIPIRLEEGKAAKSGKSALSNQPSALSQLWIFVQTDSIAHASLSSTNENDALAEC
jgi:hypothetical protein